jgi:plasmid stabilization system protein ParE
MRVVYTTEALADLESILDYITNHYPAISEAFQIDFAPSLRVLSDGRKAHRRLPSGRGYASRR